MSATMPMSDADQGAPAPELPSNNYWKRTSGFDYQTMIRARERAGNAAYLQQEVLLTRLVQSERARLGRELDLLEFGCGFGRHAQYLSALPGQRYHGYDFSEEMLAPLRASPPPTLGPASERIFSGADVLEAVGDRQFDVVFTVSVLIHNSPEQVRLILRKLAKLVREGGLLVLMENQLVSFGVYENNWHDGCWLHPYAELLPEGWDLHLACGQVATHDLYICKRSSGPTARIFSLKDVSSPRDESMSLTLDALRVQGMGRLRSWAENASARGPEAGAQHLHDRITELEEMLHAERILFQRRNRLASVVEKASALRLQAPSPPSTEIVSDMRSHGAKAALLLDAPLDRSWAQVDVRFGRVLHVFHQEWFGIRAAAGYLPGQKLAIAADQILTPAQLQQAVGWVLKGLTRTVVFHAYSENAGALMRLLRDAAGSALRIVCIWHGSSAQFHIPFEINSFSQLIELKRRGVLDAVACVKPQMHQLSADIWPQALLNVPPQIDASAIPDHAVPTGVAFIPTPNNWWKNFYTNLYVACGSKLLRKVLVTSAFTRVDNLPLRAQVSRLPPLSRAEMLDMLGTVDVSLNVTLAECQPMTALEAIALNVPCLTGPLSLGPGLDDHPYQALAQIPATGSLGDISDRLEKVLLLRRDHPEELRDMIKNYADRLLAEGIRRYLEICQA